MDIEVARVANLLPRNLERTGVESADVQTPQMLSQTRHIVNTDRSWMENARAELRSTERTVRSSL